MGASTTALSFSKQALRASLQSDLTAMLDLDAAAQAIAGDSDYARESVRRFCQGASAVSLAITCEEVEVAPDRLQAARA